MPGCEQAVGQFCAFQVDSREQGLEARIGAVAVGVRFRARAKAESAKKMVSRRLR